MKFTPILAGATLSDRLIACCGAMAGILFTGLLCGYAYGRAIGLPALVAPVGASAVLLFAVPSSPLAQPWSIIGGNLISAAVGMIVGYLVPLPMLAGGVAVALAIAAMSVSRSLHPPGGAVALGAALLGAPATPMSVVAGLIPIGVNCLVLVGLGWVFHQFSRHSYPHVPVAAPVNTHGTRDLPPQLRTGFRPEDVDAALTDLGEAFDIDREDLERLLRRVEQHAATRIHGDITCAEIMSRDVIRVEAGADPQTARALLLEHNVRALPVIDNSGHLVGSVGLRELARPAKAVGDVMTLPATARPTDLAFELAPRLTDGTSHAVMIVDGEARLVGLVTQTDLLIAMTQSPTMREARAA